MTRRATYECLRGLDTHTRTRTRTRMHTHTHTKKNYQVIHQLIGTDNLHIFKETARAEKVEPVPDPQLYHSAHPAPPRVFFDITWPAARPAPHWSGPQPAPPRNKYKIQPAARTAPQQINQNKNPRAADPRGLRTPAGCGPPRAADPRGLRTPAGCGPKPAPAQSLSVYIC